jgi:putative transposase
MVLLLFPGAAPSYTTLATGPNFWVHFTFRNRWEQFVPFLAYPPELRRMLYTTNVVESLNSQLRKALKNRGPFPNDEAVFKLFFLAIRNARMHWKADRNWCRIIAQLEIFFEGRLPV